MRKGEYCTEVLKDPGFPLLLGKQYLQMNTTRFAQVPVAHLGVQKPFSHSLFSVSYLLPWRIYRCLLRFLCPWKLLLTCAETFSSVALSLTVQKEKKMFDRKQKNLK